MKIIGLTGGIASGKTTVSDFLRKNGVTVVDADAISRALTASGGAALPQIRQVFGDAVFDGDALNRAALGKLVFGDEKKREQLNAITHPMILSEMRGQTENASARGIQTVLWDVPLLFETGYDHFTDESWLVAVPERIQLERLMARDGLDEISARKRIAAQMSLAEKRSLADFVIENDGTLEQLLEKAWILWEKRRET